MSHGLLVVLMAVATVVVGFVAGAAAAHAACAYDGAFNNASTRLVIEAKSTPAELGTTLRAPPSGRPVPELAALVVAAEGEAPAVMDLLAEETWGNPNTLARHLRDHGADFGATSAEDYANKASRFFQRSQIEGLPTKIDADGVIRVYDPETNTFGAYNPNGTTRMVFTPKRGIDYWNDRPGSSPWTGR